MLVLASLTTKAQQSPVRFGLVEPDNLTLASCPIDSTAGAMVISNYGYVSYDYNFEIIFTNHIRIKIFNSSEFSRADIKIPYSNKDRLEKLKAITYNLEEGDIVQSPLDKNDIYEEKVNDYINQKRFSLPNVKEGSIIEYTYRVNYGEWHSLAPWYFQKDIPVLRSEYVVALPDYLNYKRITKGYINIQQQRFNKNGNHQGKLLNLNVHQLIAENIPSFVEEPYLDCADDYIANTRFILNSSFIPGQFKKTYMAPSHKALSKAWAKNAYFLDGVQKNRQLNQLLDSLTASSSSDEIKIRGLYEYVRENFSVDYSISRDNLKKVLNLRRGNPEQINMILIAMLRSAGYEANIVKLSTREHGKINRFYAISTDFNKTVCVVDANGTDYLLDASDKNLPFNKLADNCINGQGLVVSKDNFHWIDLAQGVSSKKIISSKLAMNNGGEVRGKIQIARSGYEAIDFRESYKHDVEIYKKLFSIQKNSWNIKSHNLKNIKDVNTPIEEEIDIHIEEFGETAGDIIYLTPIVFGRIYENPFKAPTRIYPVNFGVPINETVNYQISIPSNFKLEEKPESIAITLPDKSGIFVYDVQEVAGIISVTSKFKISKPDFEPREYAQLKEFYAQVISKQSEQIVLKRLDKTVR